MSRVSIPAWNPQGVIPPVDVLDPISSTRSPYPVSLTDLALRFGTSPARLTILDGLLRFRAALHTVGLVDGFQWIDGSFLEDVETLESRPPNDLDVVTFYNLPAGITQRDLVALNVDLFVHDQAKATYQVDSYFQGLDTSSERLVRSSAYWYSVWSHRRNQAWKGYLEVGLDPADDPAANALLASATATGGAP
jgi:hypothetical protein